MLQDDMETGINLAKGKRDKNCVCSDRHDAATRSSIYVKTRLRFSPVRTHCLSVRLMIKVS